MKRFKRFESVNRSISVPQACLLILAVCIMFFSSHFSVSAQEVVNIPDANFRAVVEKALGKDAGAPITRAEMETLTTLRGSSADISNLSGIEAATNLTHLNLYDTRISDISPLSGLTNLSVLALPSPQISDISPLSGLTNLTGLYLYNTSVSDISPLSSLTNLRVLSLFNNRISDISPLSGLMNLTRLSLENNQISDISSLVGLTNLTRLTLFNNRISDRDTLAALTAQTVVYFQDNPGFETPGPKIEGPWLWTIAPTGERAGSTAASSGKDYLSEASGGTVNEASVAADGATEGSAVGDSVWTSSPLAPTGYDNITELVNTLGFSPDINLPVVYGVISVESPREQNTRLFVGNGGPVKVWLNGALVHVDTVYLSGASDYLTAFPVTLKQGENRLLVALYKVNPNYFLSGFFGFEDGTEYTVPGSEETQEVVNIPDASLRAAIEKALGKDAGSPITSAEMQTLTTLSSPRTNISDLSGIEAATNLTRLELYRNPVSDISPLSGLMNLTRLDLLHTPVSDISPLVGLMNLTFLNLSNTQVSDISPLVGLTNLTWLGLSNTQVSDISPLVGLTNLTRLYLQYTAVSDISPLVGLTNLTGLWLHGTAVSDISPLVGLTNLTTLYLSNTQVSDISPLIGLTNLTTLYLSNTQVSDISPLVGLTNLTYLNLSNNPLLDITPLSGLTNLIYLYLSSNPLSDITPLIGLTNLTTLDLTNSQVLDRDTLAVLTAQTVVYFRGNPAFETPGPKIEGPWLWTIAPTDTPYGSTAVSSGKDYLSEASGGTVTEVDIATNGATAGSVVGDSVWTSSILAPTGNNNITELVNTLGLRTDINTPVIYGVISLESPREQETRLYIGNGAPIKIWLNRASVHVNVGSLYGARDYLTAVPVTLEQGENRLFVAVYKASSGYPWSGFFGFEAGTEYTLLEPQQGQPADVNSNGVVDIQDLILVAANFGETRENPADVNGDGIVNIADLALVAEVLEKKAAGAPALRASALESLSAADVQHWLRIARQTNLTEPAFQRGIRFLERLLAALTPKETALLPNYPNPFNPETWIPYQLAKPASVTLSIHSADGKLVRTLVLGNQRAGIYQSRSRAAYWDGRNEVGEPVASGVYFYTLTAGEFSATRKMLIRK